MKRFGAAGGIRASIIVLVFVFAAAFAYRVLLHNPVDPDAFWHIKTGEYIVAHRSVPHTDVFSWYGIQEHLAWRPHEWLFDIGLYAVWLLGGFRFVYLVTALAYASIVPLTFALTWIRSRRYVLSLIAGLIAMAGCAHFLSPRPQVVTFALVVALAILLERRRWVWAVALTVLGINLHGGLYPIFLLVVAFYTIPKRPWVLAAAVAVLPLQPLGLQLLPYPFFAFDAQMVWFKEAMPTVPVNVPLFLAVLVALVVLVDKRRVPLRVALAALALVLLGLKGVRHTAFTYLLVIPALTPFLPGRPEAEGGSDDPDTTVQLRMDVVLAVTLLIGTVIQLGAVSGAPLNAHATYPEKAVDYLKSRGITRVWNDWGDGGYLIYRDMQPLVDGRADPFSPFFNKNVTLSREFGETYLLATDIRPFLDKYGISHLIVRRTIPLFQTLAQSRDFVAVFEDDEFVVFAYAAVVTDR